MKKKLLFISTLVSFIIMLSSCHQSPTGPIFDGSDSQNKWRLSDGVKVEDGTLSLTDKDALAVLKDGKYKDFDLTMEVNTYTGAKGALWFHTNDDLSKGYQIAINNDRQDPVWWKMSGSLKSVRNLTKSLAKENDWFKMRVVVKGNSVQVEINDNPVVDYIEPLYPYRLDKNQMARLSEGTFALVNESDKEIRFRDISVTIPSSKSYDVEKQLAEAIDEQKDPIIRLHQEDFPVQDFHVHLKGGLTKEQALIQSRKLGINYGIAPNCGIGFPITNDEEIRAYLDTMRCEPFILAMQAEGREWVTTFSPEARGEFDYVFTDAMTLFDHKGRRTRLWKPEEMWIDVDHQVYMDMIVDRICKVLQEPVDIYVNSCYLPDAMQPEYDALWTEARMNKFIDALVRSGKALEINELYQIPNKAILQKAKDAGVKFTFGSNNVTPEVSDLKYSLRMKEELGLTAKDIYKPSIKL